MHELEEQQEDPRAVAIAVRLQEQTDEDQHASFVEVTRLAETLGIEVRRTVEQKRDAPLASTYFGAGKVDEVRELLEDADLNMVVVDDELSPRQQFELEKALGVEVIDRTGMILEIFEKRAQTRLAKIEVEIARLTYELPRQRSEKNEGQRGGGGRGGRGHTSVELSKGRIRDRIASLRGDLNAAQAAEAARRDARGELFTVALVGYTNAGKSSLMRALTGSDVYVENQLFATLDTRARRLQPDVSPSVVVTDTVGFVRNLPHELVASFRSTLAEASAADLVLLVVDASDPRRDHHLEVTRSTLDALEIAGRQLVVYNKVDLVDGPLSANGLPVSAFDDDLVVELRAAILDAQRDELRESTLLIPFAHGQLLSEVFEHARVLDEDHNEDGTVLRLLASEGRLRRWRAVLEP